MSPPIYLQILAGCGLVSAVYIAITLFQLVAFYLWAPSQPLKRYGAKAGKWAFITGSSAGIGFGYAQELVSRGFNVVIHSYKADELDQAEVELKGIQPDVQVRKIVLDAADYSIEDLERTIASISELPITVLVNNVGGAPIEGEKHREYTTLSPVDIDRFLSLNVRFMAQTTRLMIPVLSRNPRSLIIAMSSAARIGMPWLAMYTSTKAFVWSFTCALAREFAADGVPIDCVSVAPGEVQSQGNFVTPSLTVLTARSLAKLVLDRVDTAVDRKMLEIGPYWVHDFLTWLVSVMPESIRQRALADAIREKRKEFAKSR